MQAPNPAGGAIAEQGMFDAVILVGGGEEVQAEVESGVRDRKRHWFVSKASARFYYEAFICSGAVDEY